MGCDGHRRQVRDGRLHRCRRGRGTGHAAAWARRRPRHRHRRRAHHRAAEPTARSYVGIDISREMLDLARQRFPDADLREGDAVGLAGLPDDAYDLVLFSYNGLDALDHVQRATALAAMARVTRPGGRVLFSSLNLDGVSFDERPWRVAGGPLSPRVRHHVAYAVRHPGTMVRSVRNYRHSRQEVEDGHGWGRGRCARTSSGSSSTSRRWRRRSPRPARRGSRWSRRTQTTVASSLQARHTPTRTTCTSCAGRRDASALRVVAG